VPLLVPIVPPTGAVQLYPVALVTDEMEYGIADPLQRFEVAPVIDPGIAGTEEIERERLLLDPHALVAATVSEPEVNEAEKFTTTEFVPCPLLIVAFAGGVQLYTTPATLVTLYVPEVDAHTGVANPLMTEGVDGLEDKLSERTLLVPQPLFAVTVIDPDVKLPEKLTDTELVPCPEAMEAFEGGVQLYVIPATFVTEYIPVVPAHTALAEPLITEGVAGVFLVIASVLAGPGPQALPATTLNVPDTVKAAV